MAGDSADHLTPKRLVGLAATLVPHAIGCALTTISGQGRPETLAYSDSIPLRVDTIQYEAGQGPCLEALETDDLVLVHNIATDDRWPDFALRCVAETPVRGMMALRLRLGDDEHAAMNPYTDRPYAFDDVDLGVASMFAPFVSMSLQKARDLRRADNLEVALKSSRQIGTAMGILMARRLVTSEQAFELLNRASQHLNRKLRDIAEEVELTGTLPNLPGTAGG